MRIVYAPESFILYDGSILNELENVPNLRPVLKDSRCRETWKFTPSIEVGWFRSDSRAILLTPMEAKVLCFALQRVLGSTV